MKEFRFRPLYVILKLAPPQRGPGYPARFRPLYVILKLYAGEKRVAIEPSFPSTLCDS